MSEIRETKRDLIAFGDGNVRRIAMAASAATTYVSIIHCNAIFSESLLLLKMKFFLLYNFGGFDFTYSGIPFLN